MLVLFAIWTAALYIFDVRAIGPEGSAVGFAALNEAVHSFTGVHMLLYTVTDWLSIIPICFAVGFGILGLTQWIKRKSLLKVDRSLLALGGFYIAVMSAYIFFELFTVNYRPVLINGILEASYPSSTTVLVISVMLTAVIQFNKRIGNSILRRGINLTICFFTAIMVIGRLVSGVHWFSDIVGGALLSGGIVLIYHSVSIKRK